MTAGGGTGPAAESSYVDLHLHSTASDGTRAPVEVVRSAAAAGLGGLSLTDHDTVDGVEEAAAEATRLGLDFLIGAELSANEPGTSIHLLAYGFDPADSELLAFMAAYRSDRKRRARAIVGRLREQGVSLAYEAVERETGAAAPTRAHVARALVAEGLVPTQQAVFDRYLSRGRPAYVEKRPTPPSVVMERVHAAGGVVVLAHPGRHHDARDVRRWAEQGLDGVEVLHPSNAPEVRRRLAQLAEELGLLKSGGSDWHGPGTHRSELGSERVPARWLQEIAERCESVHHRKETGE